MPAGSRYVLAVLFLFAAGAPAAAQVSAERPNILFIVADDLNTSLGCYGHPLVQSPNIDRLAQRGVRFERAYCQDPICNPSRTSFLSGRRPGSGYKDAVFLPDHFRRHGYDTIEFPKVAHSYGITRTTIQWTSVEKGGMARAVELLTQKRERPLFLGVGLAHTHDAVHERRFLSLYPHDRITWPAEPAQRTDLPAVAFQNINVNPNLTDAQRRDALARYYASITTLDAQVGLLLDALDRHQLWERTVVVFTSDHGKHKGEHGGIWDKRTLFEASARVPLIVAAPGRPGGQASDRLVELVDLYPTFTELCGLPAPAGLEGTSLVPLLTEPRRPWKKAAFTYASVNRGRSVRSERYRYCEWDGGRARMLFDYQADPHELRNLADDPKHQETVRQMQELLRGGWQAAAPEPAGKGG